MRKKVLVVAMLNSIHTARWLTQFKDRELDIYIFPSTYFKRLHPQIEELLTGSYACSFTISGPNRIAGLLDYLTERVFSEKITFFKRSERLNRAIRRSNPAIVHALEFQHAGYICLNVIEKHGKQFELISTNWGSDIFHFKDLPAHQDKIRRLLSYSDKYSSECERDVALALELGFAGIVLPVFPNSGGFSPIEIQKTRTVASSRELILVKSYGGYFGRARIIIDMVPSILNNFPEQNFFFYSVTDDLIEPIVRLNRRYPERVKYSTVSDPISHFDLQGLFDKARVYVGCSISDGISTSFLEALVSGAYPIQTSTSCANEWTQKGAIATLVELDSQIIFEAICASLSNDAVVDRAQIANHAIAIEYLDSTKISLASQLFY